MYYVISNSSGEMIAMFFTSPYGCNIPGGSIHEMEGSFPDLNVKRWSSDVDDFVDRSDLLTKLMFISRFTIQERMAMRASTDPVVIDIMEMFDLAVYINVADPLAVQGVNYLALVGLIAPERVSMILAQ